MVGRRLVVVVCAAAFVAGAMRGVRAEDQPAAETSESGTVSGKVIDKSTGDPIIEAGVEVVDKGKKVVTDIDGNYKIDLPPGTYQLRIFAPLFQPVRLQGVIVKPRQVTKQNASLSAARPPGTAHAGRRLPACAAGGER